jgi:hypothetical protein
MTEKELELLGFERHYEDGIICKDDEGKTWIEDEYHYYVYHIARGLELISNASNELDDEGKWSVEIFDTYPSIRFTEFGETQGLINLLESKKLIK